MEEIKVIKLSYPTYTYADNSAPQFDSDRH